ncbi:hypothetical protein BH10PSE19_BH10PSE19_12030 [soil metagenome]
MHPSMRVIHDYPSSPQSLGALSAKRLRDLQSWIGPDSKLTVPTAWEEIKHTYMEDCRFADLCESLPNLIAEHAERVRLMEPLPPHEKNPLVISLQKLVYYSIHALIDFKRVAARPIPTLNDQSFIQLLQSDSTVRNAFQYSLQLFPIVIPKVIASPSAISAAATMPPSPEESKESKAHGYSQALTNLGAFPSPPTPTNVTPPVADVQTHVSTSSFTVEPS